MTKPHKWADVLRAIADGKEVEYEHANMQGNWLTVTEDLAFTNPITHPHLNWRIKQEMVRVGRHSWPMPLSEPPLLNTEYYAAFPTSIQHSRWKGDGADMRRLQSGLVHLTAEAAEQHAAALRCINRGDVE